MSLVNVRYMASHPDVASVQQPSPVVPAQPPGWGGSGKMDSESARYPYPTPRRLWGYGIPQEMFQGMQMYNF
jgi:hypothetical protein